MKKVTSLCMSIALLCAATCSFYTAGAQDLKPQARQSVKMQIGKIINVGFVNGTSDMVNLFFSNPKTMKEGKESSIQNFVVRTNGEFNVSVSSVSATFNYRGNAGNRKALVPVSGVIKIKVDNNNTGGNSDAQYRDLTVNPLQLIIDGKSGNSQSFSVQFKATPGTEMPDGVYEVAVMYTATAM